MKAIIGRKVGMTEVFAEDGTMYPVTVVEVLPNIVTQVKTKEHDGYDAIQVGYEEKKESRANMPEKGIAKKANTVPHQFLRELKGDEMMQYQLGDAITVDIFKAGDVVDVIGTSKGKGFSGAIKRWHQKIGPKGHGSGYHRGQGTFANNGRTNNRVLPGKHMSGHSGHKSATILNLLVIAVYPDKNAILIRGGIPGPSKSVVTIRSAIKTQKHPKLLKPLIDRTPVVEQEVVPEEVVVETPVTEVVEVTPVETPVEETPSEASVEEAPVVEEATVSEEVATETPVVEETPIVETPVEEVSSDEETPHVTEAPDLGSEE
ncbi:MAG: 50S ribosomal protein L3 [Coprobacillus sp.]|nr:50S ribosomal protein L3 [Coprobacillus sp.]